MATVKAVLRQSYKDKNGKSLLKIRLLAKNQIKEITIPGLKLFPHEWDEKRIKIKGDNIASFRVQGLVLKYEKAIHEFYLKEIPIDLDLIHLSVETRNPIKKIVSNYSKVKVWSYIKEHICGNADLAYGTKKNYGTLYRFLQKEYSSLVLRDVNGKLLAKLALKLKKKGLKVNTIHSRIKCLKASINRAYENEHISKPDWRGYKNRKEIPIKRPLEQDELEILQSYLKNAKLSRKDEFILKSYLFSSYSCGMRFGDICTLKYSNFSFDNSGKIRLHYTMRKTKKEITLVLNETASNLLDIGKIGKKEMVFCFLPFQITQGEASELSKTIESKNAYINKRLKIIVKNSGINKHVHFHQSRRNFCSLCLAKGIDHYLIKEIAGVSLAVFEQTYAKLADDNKTNALALLDT